MIEITEGIQRKHLWIAALDSGGETGKLEYRNIGKQEPTAPAGCPDSSFHTTGVAADKAEQAERLRKMCGTMPEKPKYLLNRTVPVQY